eukprot:Phypoly_transcript_00708.p1 GENE.Phypoly_transcript_00708~~Phypoly_transcript_00708.p1  ORF type:complete len:1240 (+),score=205.52 Phypoly_transcript_00708:184-3903(+)
MNTANKIVIDTGTGYTKLGIGGEDLDPKFIIPTVLVPGKPGGGNYIGEEALALDEREWCFPLKDGRIDNWDNLELFWEECFATHLQLDPINCHVLIPYSHFNSPKDYEHMVEIMIEKLGVSAISMQSQAPLALATSWIATSEKTLTGVVVDIGETVTRVMPLREGYVVDSAKRILPFGGRTLTSFTAELIAEREEIPSQALLAVAKRVKETMCYTCPDLKKEFFKYDSDPTSVFWKQFEGSDRSHKQYKFDVGYERFLAPEFLFSPEIATSFLPSFSPTLSLTRAVTESIKNCSVDIQPYLYKNIAFSGGTTLIKDLYRRLQRDLAIYEGKMPVKCVNHSKQWSAVWAGGSMAIAGITKDWYTRDNYDEWGASVFCKMPQTWQEQVGPIEADSMCKQASTEISNNLSQTISRISTSVCKELAVFCGSTEITTIRFAAARKVVNRAQSLIQLLSQLVLTLPRTDFELTILFRNIENDFLELLELVMRTLCTFYVGAPQPIVLATIDVFSKSMAGVYSPANLRNSLSLITIELAKWQELNQAMKTKVTQKWEHVIASISALEFVLGTKLDGTAFIIEKLQHAKEFAGVENSIYEFLSSVATNDPLIADEVAGVLSHCKHTAELIASFISNAETIFCSKSTSQWKALSHQADTIIDRLNFFLSMQIFAPQPIPTTPPKPPPMPGATQVSLSLLNNPIIQELQTCDQKLTPVQQPQQSIMQEKQKPMLPQANLPQAHENNPLPANLQTSFLKSRPLPQRTSETPHTKKGSLLMQNSVPKPTPTSTAKTTPNSIQNSSFPRPKQKLPPQPMQTNVSSLVTSFTKSHLQSDSKISPTPAPTSSTTTSPSPPSPSIASSKPTPLPLTKAATAIVAPNFPAAPSSTPPASLNPSSSSPTPNSPSTPTFSSPSFSTQFEGEWNDQIPANLFTEVISAQCSMCNLNPASQSEKYNCIKSYLHTMREFKAASISILRVPNMRRAFYHAIEICESRAKSPAFYVDESSFSPDRQRVYNSIKLLPQVKHNRGVQIIRAWHGTTYPVARSIMEHGFGSLAVLDEGWFGKGIYFTSFPEYAERYCTSKQDPCLILCYLVIFNPYPLVYEDAADQLIFEGKGNYRNFQSHYVPVSKYSEVDFRPPKPGTTPEFDEIVIFQESHILPHAIIKLNHNNAPLHSLIPKGSLASKWNVEEVANWVSSLSLSKDYKSVISDNFISGKVLLEMTKEDWREVGVTPFGDLKLLLMEVAKLAR